MFRQFDFGVLWEFRWLLAQGFGTTVFLSIGSVITGTLLAIPVTFALLSSSAAIRGLANSWLQITRSIPLLVLLVGAYYITPALIDVRPGPFFTAWVVLSMYLGAFTADVLRSGVLSVPRDLREAGLALGMTVTQVRKRIVLPEVIRRTAPALGTLYIGLIKYTTLSSVISVNEIMNVADLIVLQRLHPIEVYIAISTLFVFIVVPAGLFARWIEHKLNATHHLGGPL